MLLNKISDTISQNLIKPFAWWHLPVILQYEESWGETQIFIVPGIGPTETLWKVGSGPFGIDVMYERIRCI
jgi:hypothetical protein